MSDGLAGFLAILLVVAIVVASTFFTGWIIMLLWGAIIQNWLWPAAPHMSYWMAVLVGLGLGVIGGLVFKD